jgi:hypothetical protein
MHVNWSKQHLVKTHPSLSRVSEGGHAPGKGREGVRGWKNTTTRSGEESIHAKGKQASERDKRDQNELGEGDEIA